MTIGTGLFLSTIVAAFVAVFIATRKSWNWKKISIRIGISLIGLITLTLAIGFGYYYLENRPKQEKEYLGIRLGTHPKDVIFENGLPDSVLYDKAECDCDSIFWYETQDTIMDNGKLMSIRFKNSKVSGVTRFWYGNPYVESIQGIGKYSSTDDVKRKFGEPDSTNESKDGTGRRWYYVKYGLRFGFEKGDVTSIGIFD